MKTPENIVAPELFCNINNFSFLTPFDTMCYFLLTTDTLFTCTVTFHIFDKMFLKTSVEGLLHIGNNMEIMYQ